jgi:uncharacterized membrane protein
MPALRGTLGASRALARGSERRPEGDDGSHNQRVQPERRGRIGRGPSRPTLTAIANSTKGQAMENVIAVRFPQDSAAYEALTNLTELDSQGQVGVGGAAVVIREEDGHITVKDEVDDNELGGTLTGGFIGLLVGILGGPLGILIGGATGLFIGSLFDMEDSDDDESVLSDISRSLEVGRATLVAQVSEQTNDVVDAAMSRLGGTVLRRPLDDVEAEMAAAEDAQREAKKAARKHLREQRSNQRKEQIRAKIEALKAKFHRPRKVGAAH